MTKASPKDGDDFIWTKKNLKVDHTHTWSRTNLRPKMDERKM